MEEIIKLLRERIVFCERLSDLFDELSDLLKKNSAELNATVEKIMPIMQSLSKNDTSTQDFLKKFQIATPNEFIETQSSGIQREMAEKLLDKIIDLQFRLKRKTGEVNILLEKGKAFVDFNLNVLSQTAASNTYGSAAEKESRRGRKIFDANV